MTFASAQRLQVLPGEFVIEHLPGDRGPVPGNWLSLIRAPEGLTVLRYAETNDLPGDLWAGVYSDTTHALDTPGMLAALITPLAAAEIPVFVASTYHADILLVRRSDRDEAFATLRQAGHVVTLA